MQAIICNRAHPDLGSATIPLPIPDKEYAHCIELLEQMQIGNAAANDCYIDQLNDAPPYLDVLEKKGVNIDELDFLARSLDRYTADEMAKFQSVAASRGIRDIPMLIDLSFCCEGVTVITDFSKLESVGKSHYLDMNGGCASTDTLGRLFRQDPIRLQWYPCPVTVPAGLASQGSSNEGSSERSSEG